MLHGAKHEHTSNEAGMMSDEESSLDVALNNCSEWTEFYFPRLLDHLLNPDRNT